MSQNVLDINLVFTIVSVGVILLMAIWLRKPEKIAEAADKVRTDPQLISTLEKKYNEGENKMLFDITNTLISLLHRSIPSDSVLYSPVASVDALVDEITDDVPAVDKPKDTAVEVLTADAQGKTKDTVTVTMPAEKGTSVEIV